MHSVRSQVRVLRAGANTSRAPPGELTRKSQNFQLHREARLTRPVGYVSIGMATFPRASVATPSTLISRLDVNASDSHSQVNATRPRLIICEQGSEQRHELERFVHATFAATHGAQVSSFLPTLLAMQEAGRICSVAGFRAAARESLFLERYLDRPIEEVLTAQMCAQRPDVMATGQPITRAEIVEVGNLAGIHCRAACRLVLALPQLLLARGFRWIVFTGTGTVRGLLGTYGTPLIELASASGACAHGTPDDWGRYYENDPRVMAGYLPEGVGLTRRSRSRI